MGIFYGWLVGWYARFMPRASSDPSHLAVAREMAYQGILFLGSIALIRNTLKPALWSSDIVNWRGFQELETSRYGDYAEDLEIKRFGDYAHDLNQSNLELKCC